MPDPVSPVDSPALDLDDVMGEIANGRVWRTVKALVAEVARLRAELDDHHCDCLARKVAEVRADRDRLAEKDKKWFTDYVSLAESLADTENARRSLAARLQAVEALCDEAVFTIALRMPDGVITYPKVVTVPKLRAALAVPAAEETTDHA